MMGVDLPEAHRESLERLSALAGERFAARAAQHDAAASFPGEDFADLFAAGLLAPAVPTAYGGLGLGPDDGLLVLWLMTAALARADTALARCWEGHVNSQMILAGLADEDQRRRWFEGIVTRGEIWAAWSGEPQTPVPGRPARFGTTIRVVDGGYLLEGTKAFATSAGAAHRAILLVNLHGPGGARHSGTGAADGLVLLACDLRDSTVSIDPTWWEPMGMRGTASHVVRFDLTFIPAGDLIGVPGQYLRDRWQALFSPHYGATFLGAAEAAQAYAIAHVRAQGRIDDPYVQHRVGAMAVEIETGELYLRHVADLWSRRRTREAQAAGVRARYQLERSAREVLEHALHLCGARGLMRPSPLERITRDLLFYVRHDNADHLLATIGREALGVAHDGSFFHTSPTSPPDTPPPSRCPKGTPDERP